MIEIEITKEMMEEAKKKSNELGVLRNSISKGSGNLAGFLGELLANKVLGGTIENTYEYDIILSNGKTVDVKTKKCNTTPKSNYECSVSAFNTKQKCDMYCFVRVKDDNTKGWVLGLYDKNKYFTDSKFLRKGDIDPDNNYVVRSDCFNIKINKLIPVEDFE